MRKAVLFFGFVYGILACGNPSEREGVDRLDLSSHQVTMEIGKVLYLKHCLHCHADLRSDNMLADRVRSAQGDFRDLQKFIRNQDSLIQAGDAYTLGLNEKWGHKAYRHSFILADAELKALWYYLETTF